MLICRFYIVFFFFKQKTAYEMRISDWSSDVCSSDLKAGRDHNSMVLDKYGNGELDMIVSVKMIDEGLDVPATRAVLILRESTSEVEYMQMVGRTIRMGSDPAYWNVQPVVLDGGDSTMLHG